MRQNLRKLEKVWEFVVNANANCYLVVVQRLIIFDAQYKSLLPFFRGGVGRCVCWLLGQHVAVKNANYVIQNDNGYIILLGFSHDCVNFALRQAKVIT